jgi:tRNA G10  N-methylase Trm11
MNRYFFLFTRGLDVTNLQFAELTSLLRFYSQPHSSGPIIWTSPPHNPVPGAFYLQCFGQSCAVYTENNIDLRALIKRAGYVHSCGFLMLAQPWDEVDHGSFINSVVSYCQEKKSRFEIIFHSCGQYNGDNDGMKNTFIDLDRYFLGRSLLNDMTGDLQTQVQSELTKHGLTQQTVQGAVFVIRDVSSLATEDELLDYPGKHDLIHMIIYHSLFLKRDMLHELNEDKPFWAGIFTTPQNLTAAMLNLAYVDEHTVLLDPFSHQGTTATEAGKLGARIYYGDLYEIHGTRDNVSFLMQQTADERDRTIREMADILSPTRATQRGIDKLADQIRQLASNTVLSPDTNGAFARGSNLDEVLSTNPALLDTLPKRLCFYIYRHYYIRSNGLPKQEQHGRVVESGKRAFEKLEYYSKNLLKGPEYLGTDIPTIRVGLHTHPNAQFVPFQGNAKDLPFQSSSVDAIITDPPYGYGSDINDENLHELYQHFFKEAFRVLKPRGYLVTCLLDKVKTGKQIAEQLKSEAVVASIIRIASESGVRLIAQEDIFPVFKAYRLFYWKSKHALNRAILSIQIDKESKS